MRKPIAVLLSFALVAALVAPAVALAKGGQGNSGAHGAQSDGSLSTARADRSVSKATRSTAKGEHKTVRASRKAQRSTEKVVRKAERRAAKVAREASRTADAGERVDQTRDAAGLADSVEGTPTVGPGVSQAFSRITTNLEKSAAKVADGRKKQLPPGLVRVWLKFAAWLGVDPSTMPRVPSSVPTSTVEPTATPVP
jgi:hypothetical protein